MTAGGVKNFFFRISTKNRAQGPEIAKTDFLSDFPVRISLPSHPGIGHPGIGHARNLIAHRATGLRVPKVNHQWSVTGSIHAENLKCLARKLWPTRKNSTLAANRRSATWWRSWKSANIPEAFDFFHGFFMRKRCPSLSGTEETIRSSPRSPVFSQRRFDRSPSSV